MYRERSARSREPAQNPGMNLDDFNTSLRMDRDIWAQHGAMPGEERLRLYIEHVNAEVVEDPDLVFLWIAWAIVTCSIDDEDAVDRQMILEEITERVMAAAVPVVSLLDDLGNYSLEPGRWTFSGGVFALEDGTTVELERALLDNGRRLLVCRADQPHMEAVEAVVVSDGACQIRTLPEGSSHRILPGSRP